MRILVLSNFYPPYYIGGYELGCYEAVEALKARGHEVRVLTSFYGLNRPEQNGEIYRWLVADIGWKNKGAIITALKLLKKEIENRRAFKRLLKKYSPDIIYIWNLGFTSISLIFTARELDRPVCFFVFDDWVSHWENDDHWYAWWHSGNKTGMKKQVFHFAKCMFQLLGLLPRKPLDLRNIQFASRYLKQMALQKGKPVDDAKIIHWGIDINQFPYHSNIHKPNRLLYVGQIVPHKGVHTSIEAMKIIVKEYGFSSVTLTIVGGSVNPDYVEYLQTLVRSYGLENNIHFTGFMPREKLSTIYQEHDILLFTSIWDEPFGITLLEAMSSGLAVIGTATGGSSEILQFEETALIFCKDDPRSCANQILRLLKDPSLLDKIREGGRLEVEEKFKIEYTMNGIERALQEVVAEYPN
jgi:glycogen synthase